MAFFVKATMCAALVAACLVAGASAPCDPKVFMTEVVDAKDYKLRYVEVFNSGSAAVDMSLYAHGPLLLVCACVVDAHFSSHNECLPRRFRLQRVS